MAPPTSTDTSQSSSSYQDLPIIINGAGLVGCMAALYMAQHHGQKVVLIDKRHDYRSHKYEGRSINLAISHRAFKALGGIDQEFVKHFKDEKVGLKMKGRGIHMKDLKSDSIEDQFGTTSRVGFQPYGIGSDEYIVSVGRHHLNCFLLEELEKRFSSVLQVEFEATPTRIEYGKMDKESVTTLHYKNKNGDLKSITGKFIIGADGLNSFVRQQMQNNPSCRFSSSQTYISHAYKELSIRPNAQTSDYVMRSDCLHIWPRGDFMLIALPNPTKDFTVTLFMRQFKKRDYGEDESVANNQPSFESVELGDCKSYDELTPEMKETNVRKFFSEQFPDAYEMVKSYIMEDWNGNPTSSLSYVQCNPHHYDNKLVLLGDSSHAIIPFYGQGVNCGFEDCHVFSNIIKEEQSKRGMKPTAFNSELIQSVFENYSLTRKASADAILNLSLHNFIVMRSKTADPLFLLEQAVMRFLHKNFPQVNAFKPLYTMVAFTPQKTYADAWNTHVNRENFIAKIKQYAVQALATCAISAITIGIYSKCRSQPLSITNATISSGTTSTPPSITEQTIQLSYSLLDASKSVAKSIGGYFGY